MYEDVWELTRDPEKGKQFTLDGWVTLAPFERLLGMEIIKAGEGHAKLTMPFQIKHCQGGGIMHGGALASLADTAVAMAIKTLLPPDSHFVTKECTVRFYAAVTSGEVRAEAKVVNGRGGGEGEWFSTECELFDDTGKLVASFKAPFKVLRRGG